MVETIRRNWRDIAALALLAGIVSGLMHAFSAKAEYHPLIEFAAGIVGGPLYFAIATAILLSTLYSGAAIAERLHARRNLHSSAEPGDGLMGVSLLLGFLLTAVWAIPAIWAVSQIPVVGEQIGRIGGED